jgi:sugar phosphate isomerase/epimerase
MNRRTFLVGTAASTALASRMRAQHQDPKRARIGISTWSFHNLFTPTREKDAPPLSGKPLDARDFPDMIADRYHVHQMEIVAPHISMEPSYVRDLKSRLDKAHSHLVNIPVDIKELWNVGGLSDTDPKVRENAISACTKWIDIAHDLGARSVRCDPGKINPKDLSPTISSYRALGSYGASKGISVIIENHGGVGSEHPEELVEIFKGAGKNCGALPDFGNFPDEATRQRGLKLLFPFGRIVCHAKGLKFDAQGNETVFNFPQCVETAKKSGFKGVYSIEFEGEGDPYEGVQHVVDELMRYL